MFVSNKKIILLDMDDVLADFAQGWLDIYNQKNGSNLTKKDITAWNFDDCGLNGEEIRNIYMQKGFFYNLKPFKEIIEVVEEYNNIFDFYVVTASPVEFCKEKYFWLKKYVPFLADKTVFTQHKFLLNMADYIIDDGPHNLLSFPVKKRIKTLMPYNKNIKSLYTIRNGNGQDLNKVFQELYIEYLSSGNITSIY